MASHPQQHPHGRADAAVRQQYILSIAPIRMAADRQREAGDAASIDVLNRLSADLGLESFAGVDTSGPQTVARVAGDFASELYRIEIKGTEARQ